MMRAQSHDTFGSAVKNQINSTPVKENEVTEVITSEVSEYE